MLKIKKGLSNILENHDNEPEAPLPPQPLLPPLPPQPPQPQTPQQTQMQVPQPPAAPRQAAAEDWGELLVKLLASAPEDVAQKLATCIDREVLMKVLQRREDPYLKVALLLLTKK